MPIFGHGQPKGQNSQLGRGGLRRTDSRGHEEAWCEPLGTGAPSRRRAGIRDAAFERNGEPDDSDDGKDV